MISHKAILETTQKGMSNSVVPSDPPLTSEVCEEVVESLVIQNIDPIEEIWGRLNLFPVFHSEFIVEEGTAHRRQEAIQLLTNPVCRHGISIDHASAHFRVSRASLR